MKILILNKKEEKALTKILSDSIINGTCHNYYLTTILEKISSGAYTTAFCKAKQFDFFLKLYYNYYRKDEKIVYLSYL